jgi:hypothetical protein
VTTLHGRLDISDLVPLYQEFREMPVISISNGQREPLPWANWQATVYHGLACRHYRFHPDPGVIWLFWDVFRREKSGPRDRNSRSKSECHSKLQRRSIE